MRVLLDTHAFVWWVADSRRLSEPARGAILRSWKHTSDIGLGRKADVMTLEQAVWVDPDRMSGTPCFRGSRLPVQQLFDWLADGVSLDDFVEDFRIDRRAAETVLRAAGVDFCDRRAARLAEQTPRA